MPVIGILCVLFALAVGIYAAYRDVVSMTIPNKCSVAILILWAVAAVAGVQYALPVKEHIIVGIAIFAVSFIFYLLKLWGGGDSKLAAAYGFWFTPQQAVMFLFIMSVVGGILAVISIILKTRAKNNPTWAGKYSEEQWIGRLAQGKSVIPYGVAVTAAAIPVIITGLMTEISR